jgi:hypothetical protein
MGTRTPCSITCHRACDGAEGVRVIKRRARDENALHPHVVKNVAGATRGVNGVNFLSSQQPDVSSAAISEVVLTQPQIGLG